VKIRVNPWPDFFGAVGAGVAVIAFCLILLWHDPLLFWNDDYEISILPVFADVARSWSEGHWPLLSPYSWICSNLAGEFQYGTFSIFVNTAVFLIWKFPLAFPQQAAALSLTHLFVLAMGAYLLARGRNLSAPLSAMVSFVATLNGWIMCWGATNWFGALGAWTWLPWAWWGLERALDPRRGRYRFVWPAPFIYLLVTGGFPYTVGMLAVVIIWLTFESLVTTKRVSGPLPMLFGVTIGVGLSAPAWLGLIGYVHGSARQVDPGVAHFQWLIPPSALPAFILPNWTVNWTGFSSHGSPHTSAELACGLAAPVALVAGLIRGRLQLVRRIKWDLILLLLVLVLSMLPSANLFRWSFRWLPLVHLLLALCAAQALRSLEAEGGLFRLGLWVFAIMVLVVAAMFIVGTSGKYALPYILVLALITIVWLVIDLLPPSSLELQGWMPTLVTFTVLLATYLCIPTNGGVPKYNLGQELLSPAPLDRKRLYLSIYPSPDDAYGYRTPSQPIGRLVRPGSTSMWAQLHFVNGYSPIRAAGVARRLGSYVHGEIDPGAARHFLETQAGAGGELATLGVDGIVVANEISLAPRPETEWELIHEEPEGRVYHRRSGIFDRVRSVAALDSQPNDQFAIAHVKVIEDSRNRVIAEVDVPRGDRPALLTFSRPYFRGYKATLGSAQFAVGSFQGLFPTLEIPAGTKGNVILVYRPAWLIWGGVISLTSLLILCSPWFLRLRDSFLRSE
jgi:hypothetical protein